MIHRALLKAVGCCITGAVGAGIVASLFSEHARHARHARRFGDPHSEEFYFVVGSVVVGALFGLIAGIGWAIQHKAARWRFVGWTAAGWIAWVALPWAFPEIFGGELKIDVPLGFGIIGTVIGIVTALESAGKFSKKDVNDSTQT